ncbi:gamma-glutamyltransferase family protein [Roseovarius faecimaris]|uniref:Gamma-glutamyltransferase family protein n=1 Tax=Roseovarius faecimaris TaxID=2494550 RepID=A0A6I6IUG1_9RHOB|nr:gamma-glutamyltransferase family protein [Roseovarius faecimaris]QGX99543.1 gamma-glutamyltransferase family protein [Roseovarius faecimaris]
MRDFQLPGRSALYASNGLCATSHPLAAQTAIDILKQGGNAMDAAIAGAVLLGFCEPQSTGLGGDCFALFTDPGGGNIRAFNGSGRAPAAADPDALRAQGHDIVPEYDAAAITIPGAVEGFCRLAADHGRLGLEAILAPSIRYAEEGVPVAPRVAFDWQAARDVPRGHGKTHYLSGGAPLPVGAIFRSPGQAELLRRVARDGADAFYTGEIAEDMLSTLTALGGVHTADDFASHRGNYTDAISGTYGGKDLLEHPPNGQGATAILMLNILKHFDLSGLDPLGPERTHLEAEAAKLAYDARNRLIADPDHTTRIAHMLAPETAAKLAALIRPDAVIADPVPLTESVHRDTVYITVVDRDRMAVSMIYSIFHSFGSGYASEKFSVLFQNRGAGFCLSPGHPNELGGGKRPMHTIIPAMLAENGQATTSFGVMGGAYQPCGHARYVSNRLDYGMEAQTALDAPRAFAEEGVLKLERGYSEATRAALSDLGHKVVTPDAPIGGAQAITILPDGVLEGASDPRKDGCALGY